jgi:hypothetical protein
MPMQHKNGKEILKKLLRRVSESKREYFSVMQRYLVMISFIIFTSNKHNYHDQRNKSILQKNLIQ